jgi:hypothetical protein
MSHGLMTVALAAAMQVGQPSPSETPNYPPLQNAYNQYGFEGKYEQRYPFDTQQNWVHGYHQEIPAYGGHVFFRPYNYKDVLSQSQTAAGWGMSPTMPYSQQYWHRYHDQATMLKLSRTSPTSHPVITQPMSPQQVLPASAWSGSMMVPTQQFVVPNQPAMTSSVIVEQAPLLPGYGYQQPPTAAPQFVLPAAPVYPPAPR